MSFDIRSHPRRDDNINNLQPTDETSAIYGDQGMADGYDVEEHSSQDYANEEGYDSANYDGHDDSYIHGQETKYMPQTYDSEHQSHNNDYDDEVGSKSSPICLALLAGIFLKKMTLATLKDISMCMKRTHR